MIASFDNDVERCLTVLQNGGIILYPTDTIWGIGCDASNEEAVQKIISLKHRPDNKSFVVLIADERDILKYVAAPDLALFDYLQKSLETYNRCIFQRNWVGRKRSIG